MVNATSTTRFRFWLWLISVIGVIVPRRLRADWRREWEAELRHREELLAQWDRLDWRSKLDLLRRSASAFWDALWLQPKRLEDEMFQDLRFGVRMLLKSKGFTTVAVLSLALGIGANTALFSVMDAVLLKTLPVDEPERLVLFEWQAGLTFRTNGMSGTSSDEAVFRHDIFEKMRAVAQESPLSDFFAFAPIYEGIVVAGDQAEVVKGQAVSGGYYAGLRAQPILGRAINDEDDKPGAAPVGGAVGALFAFWGRNAIQALTDKDAGFLPNDVDISLNWRALAFTFAVSLLTGALFGLAPAWRATSRDLATSLKQSRRTSGAVSRLSKGLIIAQVALSLLILVGAGLFIRTLYNLQRVNLGFNQENLLIFKLKPDQGGYKDERLFQFYQRLFDRLDNLPGVRGATFQRAALIANDNWANTFLLPGETEMTARGHGTRRQTARENYFKMMEIPLLRGRDFTAQDDQRAPNVAIVNQTFARRYFPDDDALGKRVTFFTSKREVEIVGVVADTKYMRQREEHRPLLYTPWRQEGEMIGAMHFALRTTGEPTALAASVRLAVRELDNNLPVTEVTTQTARSRATLGQERLYARLLSFFGVLALLLAAIGISGVLAYSVAQRTNEIGIHMALGAQPADVLRLVISQGMKLVLLGLAVGTLGGYALKRLLANQNFASGAWQRQITGRLYGVEGTDPATFTVIASLLALVALLACWLPARKAAQVDPLDALRHD